MKAAKLKGFNAKEMIKEIVNPIIDEQTRLFIDYAKENVNTIAKGIQSYGYSMDRTGNLLDSLCWVVSYNGKMVGSGFYRETQATRDSYLHELFNTKALELMSEYFPVFGHALAEDFIERWGKKSEQGQWVVAFGILAPYWGYWEVGHQNVLTGRKNGIEREFKKFAVMAEFFDKVTEDLKPAKTAFYRSRPHYTMQKLKKQVNRYANDAYAEKKHFERWKRRK